MTNAHPYGMNRDRMMLEMAEYFKAIANWTTNASDFELTIVCEELAKLSTHLETMQMVQHCDDLGDLDA